MNPAFVGFPIRKRSRQAWSERFWITGQGSAECFSTSSPAATSLLVAAERGLSSVGIELLPYAQWGADTIVRAHAADSACFDRVVGEAVDAARYSTGRPLTLPVPAASWALSDEVAGALLALREA